MSGNTAFRRHKTRNYSAMGALIAAAVLLHMLVAADAVTAPINTEHKSKDGAEGKHNKLII